MTKLSTVPQQIRVFSLTQPGWVYGETPVLEVHANNQTTADRIRTLAREVVEAKKKFNIADNKRSWEKTKIFIPFAQKSVIEWAKHYRVSKECFQVFKNAVETLTHEIEMQGDKIQLIDPRTAETLQHKKMEEKLLSLTMKFN